MSDVRTSAAELLADNPELADAFRTMLEVDADGPWTFEDVPLDSGQFGEIVSRDIVEKTDDGYRVADRQALQSAIDGDVSKTDGERTSSMGDVNVSEIADWLPSRGVSLGVVSGLLVVVLARLISFGSVFRGSDVVLSGNDPYYYRYLVEETIRQANGVVDFSVLSALPAGSSAGEPLLVATLSYVTLLFGGSPDVAGVVLALYPVVAAVLTAVLVGITAAKLTQDARVVVASVFALALIPVHAYRTGLGYADHHAFDFLWLAVTIAALVSLTVGRDAEASNVSRLLAAVGLGIGIAGQTLAWEAGPLLIVPLSIVVFGWSILAVREDVSPLRETRYALMGIGLGAVLTGVGHLQFAWHGQTTAVTPALLAVGSIAVVAIADVAWRFDLSSRATLGVQVVGIMGAAVVASAVFGDLVTEFQRGLDRLLTGGSIAETASLISGDLGSIVAPVLFFGLLLFLALPYAVWAVWRAWESANAGWLALAVYTGYFLLLALVQVRFAGELSVPLAVFAGLGFVHLGSIVDVLPRPVVLGERETASGRRNQLADGGSARDGGDGTAEGRFVTSRREFTTLLGLGGLVGSLSFVQIPVKTSQLTIPEEMYQTAIWMRSYAEERGWSYPNNYVFSRWGRNRVFNYFVSGESRSYGYARANYGSFLQATNGQEWYSQLQSRAGFVAVTDTAEQFGADTLGNRLWTENGGGDDSVSGLGHYRLAHVSSSAQYKVYTLVEGVTLKGAAEADATVTVRRDVEREETTFTYERTVTANEEGQFTVRVPYEGEYQIEGADASTLSTS
jgi:dolichyl-diphosphooligosaccharide--protein glycosyltransferase